jgi:hypothetical protein
MGENIDASVRSGGDADELAFIWPGVETWTKMWAVAILVI